jgi:hypothetical protein
VRRWSPRNKYGSIPTTVNGIRFHSKREAGDYQVLKLRERAGDIRELRLQAKVPLVVNGFKVADYLVDFCCFEPGEPNFTEPVRKLIWSIYGNEPDETSGWRFQLIDSKGWRTQVYSLKKKLVAALYGLDIRET